MKTNVREDSIIAALDEALATTLCLRRGNDLNDFLAPGNQACYLIRPQLRIARHFDVNPACLVFDPLLGSFGIVEVVLPEDGADPKKIGNLVRRHIDTASYARHLLLRDSDLRGRKALTVELVLLTSDETTDDQQALDAIGEALRQALRGTDSLQHISIGLLCYAGTKNQFKDRLRRAFPWFLKATRDWLVSPRAVHQNGEASEARHLRAIKLSDYRLPGVREIVLSQARVHLVQGPNGSGKSSIAEALELASTGKVERLERAGEKNYHQVIRHRNGAVSPATIELGWSAGTSEVKMDIAKPVVATGIEQPLDASVDAGSFRLDQPLMDRLIGLFPHERANNFLRAFFPEARDSLNNYSTAAQARTTAMSGLMRVIEIVERAKKALTELHSWRSSAASAGQREEAFPVLLNQWLEKTAFLDLVQRERTVRTTIHNARAAGWTTDDANIRSVLNDLGADRDITALETYERRAKTEADDLLSTLDAYSPMPSTAAAGTGPANQVTLQHTEALNTVSRWLFNEDSVKTFGHFGDKLARVINGGEAPTYATLIIGADQWADPALKQLDTIISACKAIVAGLTPPPWPGLAPCSEFDEAAKAQRLLLETGNVLSERFIAKLQAEPGATGEFDGSLIAAINELMALFTPARWSYSDIKLPPRLEDGKLGLNIELGDYEKPVRAELHLNTAELNLFTVALFLLCAARVRKPLNLLLFDDPLQNMDELTSTALARGLVKVIRLWASLGRNEELLVLFHGYDDLERFRLEVAAATYRLPWLSPSQVSSPLTIESEDKTAETSMEVQDIKKMLEPRPPSAIASKERASRKAT